jgi:hypothetical protein
MTHYRIYECDPADHIVDGYAVICGSDTAALRMACKCAGTAAVAVEVWESCRRVARLGPETPWGRLRRMDQPTRCAGL